MMAIGVYSGTVRHRRYTPKSHAFGYRLFMTAIDADRPEQTVPRGLLWRLLTRFRRTDHGGDPATPLGEWIRERVAAETGRAPSGEIVLLTQLRQLGLYMNPVCFYFCVSADGERVETLALEVQNTPWNERHVYVLPLSADGAEFAKAFHVSPFMEMDMTYRLRCKPAASGVVLHLENWRSGALYFDATLHLRRRRSPSAVLAAFPFMTSSILAAIYFEAFRLWRKGVPYVPHPKHGATPAMEVSIRE